MTRLDPTIAQLLDQGLALHRDGRLDDALNRYDRALALDGGQPDALSLKGVVLLQSGDAAGAAAALEQAAKRRPRDAIIQNDLGTAREATGDFDGAASAFAKAVKADRKLAPAQANLARMRLRAGKIQQALHAAEQAVKADPALPEGHTARGVVLEALGRADEALAAYDRVLELNPQSVDALYNRGSLLQRQGRSEDAKVSLEAALALAPMRPDIRLALGLVEADAGRPEAAVAIYNAVLEQHPDYVLAYINRGDAYERLGDPGRAEGDYRAALALAPDQADATHNLARLDLLHGRLASGWDLYEERWRLERFTAQRRHEGLPRWDGSMEPGLAVLAWGEQGVGDQIMFAGLLADMTAAGLKVTVEVDPRLAPILARARPDMAVYGYDQVPKTVRQSAAAQVPLGSLGAVLRRSREDFPPPLPYLAADPERTTALRARYEELADGRKTVGIAWHSTNPWFGAAKSLPLAAWAPILATPGVSFVSLQYGEHGEDIAAARAMGADIIVDESIDPMSDLEGAAAQAAAVDLVIAISSTPVHLAGAMGREVWVLTSEPPEWRWGLGEESTLWYPSVRLLRQPSPGDWTPVAERTATDLKTFAGG